MKTILLLTVLLTLPAQAMPNMAALMSAVNACAHCVPVNEPTGDPCSIAGWCGNGNPRARTYYYDRGTGTWRYSPCANVTGMISCSY